MIIKNPRILLVLACCYSLIFTGCKKKEVMEVDNETQSAVDYAIAEQEFMGIVCAAYQSASVTKGVFSDSLFSTCDTLAFLEGDRANYNATYALNLSNTSCIPMPDGRTRSGQILVKVKEKPIPAPIVLKLNAYISEGITFSCDSIILTPKNTIRYKEATFDVKLVNGSCRTADYTIKLNYNRQMLVYYKSNNGPGVDGYTIAYGETSGTNRKGMNFSTTKPDASRALVKDRMCAYISQGSIELTPAGFKTRTINFGDGPCDDEATFTVNENTVAFKLK